MITNIEISKNKEFGKPIMRLLIRFCAWWMLWTMGQVFVPRQE